MNRVIMMDRLKIVMMLLLFTSTVSQIVAQESTRVRQLFNFGWKYHYGNIDGAEQRNFDDSDWLTLDLPHDFQIEQPWDSTARASRGFKPMGDAWYRKTFRVDPLWQGKRIIFDFEGILVYGDVYVNGKKVGGTDYGYVGFEVDVTDQINWDDDNSIAVHASTGQAATSRWYTGGGIYRDVHLLLKDSIAIARHGIYITTPTISTESAQVNVQVEVEGMQGSSKQVQIISRIFDPKGKLVARTEYQVPIKRKTPTVEVPLPAVQVSAPQMWSCETPQLYTVEVLLMRDGKVLDQLTENFGIRTIEFSSEYGFKLNGKKVILKGIANHHDLGAVGVAAHEAAIERQFKQLKTFGYNHIRLSHNPYSRSFLKMADKYGILIVDEIFDKWGAYWPARVPFTELWYKAIPEWIKQDRNHPSVIMWSLGNELQVQEGWTGFPMGDFGVTAYKILDVLVKRFDDTRKTTVAMFPANANYTRTTDSSFKREGPAELSLVTEVASFNYLYEHFNDYWSQYPDLTIYQSEATTREMGKAYYGMDLDRVVGLAYWGGIQYWGESHGWPRKGWTYAFFDRTLHPFPQAYLIKSIFVDEPLVHIAVVDEENQAMEWNDVVVGGTAMSSHWNRKQNSKQNIFTYTNADEVELFVNGKSIGVQQNDRTDAAKRNVIFWKEVPYQAGKITAVARTDGNEVAQHQLETTGKAVALKIEVENNAWKANGMDLQYVNVYAVDSKGRKVYSADPNEVQFEVSGAARLIAVDNGDHSSEELFAGNSRRLYNGFTLAILRSNQKPGLVKLTAQSVGLKAASIQLTTK